MKDIQKIFIGTFLVIIVIGGYLITYDKKLLNSKNIVVGTAASLFSLGKDVSCTFEYTEYGQVMNGIVYITKNKDMRGDFTTAHPEKGSIETHVIQKGGYVYSWGLPGSDGSKTKVDENSNSTNQIGNYNKKISTRSDVQYSCQPWEVDLSVFELPGNLAFQNK